MPLWLRSAAGRCCFQSISASFCFATGYPHASPICATCKTSGEGGKAASLNLTTENSHENHWVSRLAGWHQGRQRCHLNQERRAQGLSLWVQQPFRGKGRHESRGAYRGRTRGLLHHGIV